MARTTPYIALRMAVYFGTAAALIIVTGASAWIGYGIGGFADDGSATAPFLGRLGGFPPGTSCPNSDLKIVLYVYS